MLLGVRVTILIMTGKVSQAFITSDQSFSHTDFL